MLIHFVAYLLLTDCKKQPKKNNICWCLVELVDLVDPLSSNGSIMLPSHQTWQWNIRKILHVFRGVPSPAYGSPGAAGFLRCQEVQHLAVDPQDIITFSGKFMIFISLDISWRKFGSQTSDNMDRWSSRGGSFGPRFPGLLSHLLFLSASGDAGSFRKIQSRLPVWLPPLGHEATKRTPNSWLPMIVCANWGLEWLNKHDWSYPDQVVANITSHKQSPSCFFLNPLCTKID